VLPAIPVQAGADVSVLTDAVRQCFVDALARGDATAADSAA
jgi:hypothetical protein